MLSRGINPYAMPRSRMFSPYSMPIQQNSFGIHAPMTDLYMPQKEKAEIIWPWQQEGETNPDYLCLIFHGRRGRGKSTGATAFAKYLYDTNRRMNPDYKVYTNYRVNFADMAHPRLVDALITFPDWLHDCLILIDEIAVYFPSTRATSTNALNFATFLQEIRKLHVDLIFTTQFPTMIIGSASIQIDLFVRPRLYHWQYDDDAERMIANSVQMDCVDWWGQWSDMPISHRWPPNDEDVIVSPSLHNLYTSGLYDEFNTNEIIPAFWHPSRMGVMSREWGSEMAAEEKAEEEALATTAPEATNIPQVATTLVGLLNQQTEQNIRLSGILRQAQKVDSQIKSYKHLATAMRGMGWSCFQQGGSTGEWWGERME